MVYFWHCSVSGSNRTCSNIFVLELDAFFCDFVFWGFQNTMICHQQLCMCLTCLWFVVCMRVYFRLNHRLCVLHHYLVFNMSPWLLFLYFLHQLFSGTIMNIQSGWSSVQRSICDNRLLHVVFNRTVCMNAPDDHGRWAMILWRKFRNYEV